jgi:LCP family protein required for cell wall assembly
MLLVAAVIGVAGTMGVLRAANARTDSVERVGGLDGVLADVPDGDGFALDQNGERIEYPAVNYLLVGSDSREGIEASDPDFVFTGGSSDVGGRRSDTIMILRQERNGGASLISLPRDLWVEIAGTGKKQRINSAFNEGPERLAATITQSLGIPIHHYVEVDFLGFKQIIDDLGGVEICVGNAARDTHSGLSLDAGCQLLDGVEGLAFARSRYYEQWNGSEWVIDPRADLGRVERQQFFMRSAVNGALLKLRSSPFSSGDILAAVTQALRIDDRLDPIDASKALRQAFEDGLRTYRLPVVNDTVGTAAVLQLGEGSDQVLAYFRGDAPAPAEFETGTTVPTEGA